MFASSIPGAWSGNSHSLCLLLRPGSIIHCSDPTKRSFLGVVQDVLVLAAPRSRLYCGKLVYAALRGRRPRNCSRGSSKCECDDQHRAKSSVAIFPAGKTDRSLEGDLPRFTIRVPPASNQNIRTVWLHCLALSFHFAHHGLLMATNHILSFHICFININYSRDTLYLLIS